MSKLQELQQQQEKLRAETKAAWNEMARASILHDAARDRWIPLRDALENLDKEIIKEEMREQARTEILAEIQAQQSAVPTSNVTENQHV